MIDEMANHGNRIRDYMDRFGVEEVETFIDNCLSVEDLVDIHSTQIKRRDDSTRYHFQEATEEEEDAPQPTRFQSKGYMDSFVNPKAAMDAEGSRRRGHQRAELEPRRIDAFAQHHGADPQGRRGVRLRRRWRRANGKLIGIHWTHLTRKTPFEAHETENRRNIRQIDHPRATYSACDGRMPVYHRTSSGLRKVALGSAACL
jgi:hypothetical protein